MRLLKDIKEFKENNLLDDNNEFLFDQIVKLGEEQDIEFIGVQTIDREDMETFEKLEAIHLLVFQSFNTQLDISDLNKMLYKLSDPEFAYYQATQVGDLILVTASI